MFLMCCVRVLTPFFYLMSGLFFVLVIPYLLLLLLDIYHVCVVKTENPELPRWKIWTFPLISLIGIVAQLIPSYYAMSFTQVKPNDDGYIFK